MKRVITYVPVLVLCIQNVAELDIPTQERKSCVTALRFLSLFRRKLKENGM